MARISTGPNYGNTSRKTSSRLIGGGDQPSISGPLEVRDIDMPALQPAARPVSTFISASPGPTLGGAPVIPTPPRLPDAPRDMANLAQALGSFNPVLERFSTMYVNREQKLERQAEEEARGLAVALQSQGVNVLEPIDKMRREAETLAAQGDVAAQRRYNLLRNIDPRVQRWLPEALEEQQGIAAISTLQSHIQNLRDANGQPLVVNPFPMDGTPDVLGQEMASYIGQVIQSPRVFSKLSDRLQAAYANGRAWMSGEHAKQQDENASTAANVSLNNAVASMNGDGLAGTTYFESIRNNGGSASLFREAKKNFISNFANTILGSVSDRAQLAERSEKAILELSSIRVGPMGPNGEPPPRLVDQLEGGEAAALLTLETALLKGYADIDNARDAGEAGAGEEEQALRFESARGLLEGNPAAARDWFDSERQRIAAEPDENKRRAMTSQLAADEQLFQNGALAIDQRRNAERLEDYIDNSSDTAAQKLARIRTLGRANLISEGDRRYAESLVRPEAQDDRSEFKREQREKEESLREKLSVYRSTREENFGNFTEADGRWVDEQAGRARNEAKKIWGNTQLSQEEKLQRIRDLYQKEEEKVREQSGQQAPASPAAPSPRSGRGTTSPGGVRPSPLLPAPLSDAGGQAVDTPRAIASRLSRGRRGNVQENQRLYTQARSEAMYRRDIFMQQVKALEEGKPLDADTKLIIARTGMKPSEFLAYQYKAHNKGKEAPAEFRKWAQSLDRQLVSSASVPGSGGGGSSLAQRVAARLRSTFSSIGDPFIPPAVAGDMNFAGRPASVVYERPGGQPGVDYWFPSKQFPAVLNGRVKDIGREPGYGNYVVVESTDPRNGQKVDVLYGHLPDGGIYVRRGQSVNAGQLIGRQGGTGNVRSSDGTIASVDFFAPRPAGSRDMTPYGDFDGLRRWVTQRLQSGGQTYGSVSAPTIQSSVTAPTTRRGGGTTGLVTYYTGGGGQDGVAGGPTANGERYNPKAMTAAVQWSLRGKYLNKWLLVEDLDTGKSVRVWANDVGPMGGDERSPNKQDPRIIDLSPAAFTRLFGSLDRGVGRIRVRLDKNQRRS